MCNPGFWTWDVGSAKTLQSRKRERVQFRLEVFNLLNHPNGDVVNSNPRSGSFGQITNKFGQRQIQLALIYSF